MLGWQWSCGYTMDSPEVFSLLLLFLMVGNCTICFPCVGGVPAILFVATAQFVGDDTFFCPCFGDVGAA